MRGEALVDKLPKVFSDRLASMPVGDTEIASGILSEAIEAFAKGLVIDFFPHRQQPFRRCGFRESDCVHSILLDCDIAVGSRSLVRWERADPKRTPHVRQPISGPTYSGTAPTHRGR